MANRLLFLLLAILVSSGALAKEDTAAPNGGVMGAPNTMGMMMSFPAQKYQLPVNTKYCADQEKRCAGQKMEETTVCLIGPDTAERNAGFKLAVYRWCGLSVDKFPVNSKEDIQKTFDSLLQKCVKIKDLRIFAHGFVGGADLGYPDLDIETTRDKFANYSCLMSADANIEMMSCNTGRGCRGEDFMANFAQTMLPKGGKFTANTHYGVTPLVGIVPFFSVNLTKREVTYKPNSWPRYEWNLVGTVSGIKNSYKQDAKVCADELKEAVVEFQDAAKDADDKKCVQRMSSDLVKKVETLKTKFEQQKISDMRTSQKYFKKGAVEYSETLNSLERVTRRISSGDCDIKEDSKKSKSKSEKTVQ